MTEPVTSIAVYLRVAMGLFLLLGLTIGVAFVDLGPLNLLIAVAIASVKAVLVVLFFMHVRSGPKIVTVVALAGLFWLTFMFILTFTDFFTRSQG